MARSRNAIFAVFTPPTEGVRGGIQFFRSLHQITFRYSGCRASTGLNAARSSGDSVVGFGNGGSFKLRELCGIDSRCKIGAVRGKTVGGSCGIGLRILRGAGAARCKRVFHIASLACLSMLHRDAIFDRIGPLDKSDPLMNHLGIHGDFEQILRIPLQNRFQHCSLLWRQFRQIGKRKFIQIDVPFAVFPVGF